MVATLAWTAAKVTLPDGSEVEGALFVQGARATVTVNGAQLAVLDGVTQLDVVNNRTRRIHGADGIWRAARAGGCGCGGGTTAR